MNELEAKASFDAGHLLEVEDRGVYMYFSRRPLAEHLAEYVAKYWPASTTPPAAVPQPAETGARIERVIEITKIQRDSSSGVMTGSESVHEYVYAGKSKGG